MIDAALVRHLKLAIESRGGSELNDGVAEVYGGSSHMCRWCTAKGSAHSPVTSQR